VNAIIQADSTCRSQQSEELLSKVFKGLAMVARKKLQQHKASGPHVKDLASGVGRTFWEVLGSVSKSLGLASRRRHRQTKRRVNQRMGDRKDANRLTLAFVMNPGNWSVLLCIQFFCKSVCGGHWALQNISVSFHGAPPLTSHCATWVFHAFFLQWCT